MITLKEGDKAPAFTGKDQNGNTVRLADYKGKKVLLYFYPQDDSPTCTVQACNLRDHFGRLRQHGFEVIGVSPDDEQSHQKFQKKYELPFTLMADPAHRILKKYGVWGRKKMFGHEYMGVLRTTFVIDEKGIIRKIFLRPNSKAHADEIIRSMQTM